MEINNLEFIELTINNLLTLKHKISDKYYEKILNSLFVIKKSIINKKPLLKVEIKNLNEIGLIVTKEIEDVDNNLANILHEIIYFYTKNDLSLSLKEKIKKLYK